MPPQRYAFSYTLMLPAAGERQPSAAASDAQKLWRQAMAEPADTDSVGVS